METGYTRLLMSEQSRGRVFVEPGWLPPANECPELAGLREEHERLLGVVADKLAALSALTRRAEDAERLRAEAVREAILSGEDEPVVELDLPSDEDITRARQDYEAAAGALEIWVGRTLQTITHSASKIEVGVAERLRAAEQKRAEAARLLAEAERLSAQPQRLRNWLDRYVDVTDAFSGETRKASVLGPIAFDTLDLPRNEPIPDLIREIAGLGPAVVVDVGGDDLEEVEKEAIVNG